MLGEIIDTAAYIEYGILISIVIAALLLFVLASANSNKKLNVLSYIIAAALVALLSFQMSRLVSGYKLMEASNTITNLVGLVSPAIKEYASSLTNKEIGWFIFRRVLWSAIFTGVAGVCIYITMDKKRSRRHNRPDGASTGRRYTSTTRRRR